MYCTKCGNEIGNEPYCPMCGTRIRIEKETTSEWNEFGCVLETLALSLAKLFLYIISGGIVISSALSACALLFIGVYSLYHFAMGEVLFVPVILAEFIDIYYVEGIRLMFLAMTVFVVAMIMMSIVKLFVGCIKRVNF